VRRCRSREDAPSWREVGNVITRDRGERFDLARAGLKVIAGRSGEPPLGNKCGQHNEARLYLASSLKAAAIRECKFIPRV
jgi:hypothetical protein